MGKKGKKEGKSGGNGEGVVARRHAGGAADRGGGHHARGREGLGGESEEEGPAARSRTGEQMGEEQGDQTMRCVWDGASCKLAPD